METVTPRIHAKLIGPPLCSLTHTLTRRTCSLSVEVLAPRPCGGVPGIGGFLGGDSLDVSHQRGSGRLGWEVGRTSLRSPTRLTGQEGPSDPLQKGPCLCCSDPGQGASPLDSPVGAGPPHAPGQGGPRLRPPGKYGSPSDLWNGGRSLLNPQSRAVPLLTPARDAPSSDSQGRAVNPRESPPARPQDTQDHPSRSH